MAVGMIDWPSLLSGKPGRGNTVRLRTLIYLRWLAVLGQTTAVVVATEFLGLDLRIDLCALIISVSALLNIALSLILPENTRLSQRDAAAALLFDILQLAALLFLTGGLTNPFAALMLAQTIIAATVLSLRATLFLGGASLALIGALSVIYQPLRLATGETLEIPALLVTGSWIALSIAILFLGVYARTVSTETANMSEALTATQLALEREQKLTALGGVVAAAAHELGTPLATIMLTAAELEDDLKDRPELQEDITLIREQTERCRGILASMGQRGKQDELVRYAPFRAVVAEAAEPHVGRGKAVVMRVRGATPETDIAELDLTQPEVARKAELIHGLRNLVQNAVDFAASTVWIDIDWSDTQLMLRVGDDGRGYPPELLGRIGDPFLRGRGSRLRSDPDRPNYEGMGLGLFIAKTLLERTGASLTFANGTRRADANLAEETNHPPGAIVEAVWSRAEIEVPRQKVRGALGDNLPVEL